MRISDWSSDVCSSDLDKTIAANSDAIAPARTAADALRLNKEGKLIAFKSMENSYPLGEDLSLLKEFYDKGQIGRASCRERVCQYVYISVVAVSLKNKKQATHKNKHTKQPT